MFGPSWIKSVGTFLAVQNAHGRDVDAGGLQVLDCGVGGLLVQQECRKLVDRSMAELINDVHRAPVTVFSFSSRCFQDTLGRSELVANELGIDEAFARGASGRPGFDRFVRHFHLAKGYQRLDVGLSSEPPHDGAGLPNCGDLVYSGRRTTVR